MPGRPAKPSTTERGWPFARLKWVLGAALLATLGGGGAMLGSGGTAAVAEALKDPLSLLTDRSPGSRPEGALYATKHARQKAAAPVELVLAEERERPPLAAEDATPDSTLAAPAIYPLAAPAPLDLLWPDAPQDAVLLGPPGSPLVGRSPPGILVPIGGLPTPGSPTNPGSPGCCTPGTPTTPIEPIIPAVPEPATWAMLILGFFMVGGSLRARQRRGSLHAG